MKEFPILYKRNVNKSIQQWQIICDNEKYWTIYGQVDGKLVTTEPTIVTPKNIGKKHETSPEEQCEKEAVSLFKLKKQSENYNENIDLIDELIFQPPMLAKNYNDFSEKIKFPVLAQPKLDGLRCNVNSHKGISRRGNAFCTIGHILSSLEDLMSEYPSITFDGELYCDKLNNDFNKITSLVKQQKPTQEELDECHSTIEYHVYDMWDNDKTNMIFSDRNKILNELLKDKPFIKIVETYVANNVEELNYYFELFLDQGFEGQIIRLDEPYEHKRSKNLLKRKNFIDEEFIILDICEGLGNKAGMAAYAIMQDKRTPQTFKSNIKGTWDFCKDLLVNKNEYIGKEATVTYFCLTPENVDNEGNVIGGIPRFPYLKSLRNYE